MHKGLLTLAFLGLAISGYLLITYASPAPIACVTGEGCFVAQLSNYASFMGIPTPAYGVAFYFALGTLGALWSQENRKKLTMPLVVLTSIGIAISLFLTYVEAFIIHAWCSWCLMSAVLTFIAFIITWRLLSNHNNT